jgi:hypothetical protein
LPSVDIGICGALPAEQRDAQWLIGRSFTKPNLHHRLAEFRLFDRLALLLASESNSIFKSLM